MGQIVDPIVVQIQLDGVVPKITNPIYTPACAGKNRAASFDRMQITRENVFRELVVIRVRADAEPDVILGHSIGGHSIAVALIKGETNRIFGDLVSLQRAAIARLKNEPVSSVPTVDHEPI